MFPSMAERCLKFLLKTAFLFASTPFRFKDGRISTNFTLYITRKVLVNGLILFSVFYYNILALSWHLSSEISPFTLKLTWVFRLFWVFQELIEVSFICLRRLKIQTFLNDLIVEIRLIQSDLSMKKKAKINTRRLLMQIQLGVLFLIGWHSLSIPYAFRTFDWIFVLQINHLVYAAGVFHFLLSSMTLIVILKLIQIQFNSIQDSLFVNMSNKRHLLQTYSKLHEFSLEFLNLFGEIVIVRVFLVFLISTFGSYMQIYVHFFLPSTFQNNGIGGTKFYGYVSLLLPCALVICVQYNSVTESVSYSIN